MEERGSVYKSVEVVVGSLSDYNRLARFHYRVGRLGPFVRIFSLKLVEDVRGSFGDSVVGVIVYSMPSIGSELRDVATCGLFRGYDGKARLRLINKNVVCISRVIIDPRFRGLGLASRLVRETMGRLGRPMVESAAVMGHVNPFFEKAGMRAFKGKQSVESVRLIEALSSVGIEESELVDTCRVHDKIEGLGRLESEFIDKEVCKFIGKYGKRRRMPASFERTEFVLSKLGPRPVYYVWFNPEMEMAV
jgi:GNAT superfamily N-acetyltransferase